MLEELQRRNYSQTTVTGYIKTVADFAEYFQRPPDQLGPDEIRQYQLYLLKERKQGVRTVGNHTAALRFFFCKTLKRNYPIEEVLYPRAARKLPIILTQEEAVRLIDSASNLFHRAMLMTLYSTGMRRAELCHLKVEDIDSTRMIVHIRHGKRNCDRDVPLSPKLLETLREYWRWMQPKTYLFPGTVKNWRADKPITPKVLWEACREAAQAAGITKDDVRPHLLRHASAYYTTFQSSFILKAIGLDQAQSTAVYGRHVRLALVPARPAILDLCDRLPTAHTV
jgi:site-specific recombinase XerD